MHTMTPRTGVLLTLTLAVVLTASAPVNDAEAAKTYLVKYGHLKEELRNVDSAYVEALEHFQQKLGLPITGILDDETKELMAKDRCGCPDSDGSQSRRRKRYLLHRSKYSFNNLTHVISGYSSKVARSVQDAIVKDMLALWAAVTPLTFTKLDDPATIIKILFTEGNHGDGFNFDGPGGVLGHAFLPSGGGDVHIDDADVQNSTAGRSKLEFIMLHEFGHSLGLLHSANASAVMYPILKKSGTPQLHQDDINGIQAIYGAAPSTTASATTTTTSDSATTATATTEATSTPTTPTPPDVCSMHPIDTAVKLGNNKVYLFKGKWALEFVPFTNRPELPPRLISDVFPGLPNDLDAAFTWPFNITVFFKGSEYYTFTNYAKLQGPEQIAVGFEGLINAPDASFYSPDHQKTFIFQGQNYYALGGDLSNFNKVLPDYPRSRSIWPTPIAESLTAAVFYQNNKPYLFYPQNEYYRLSVLASKHVQIDANYPKTMTELWYGCAPPVPAPIRSKRQTDDVILSANPLDKNTGGFVTVTTPSPTTATATSTTTTMSTTAAPTTSTTTTTTTPTPTTTTTTPTTPTPMTTTAAPTTSTTTTTTSPTTTSTATTPTTSTATEATTTTTMSTTTTQSSTTEASTAPTAVAPPSPCTDEPIDASVQTDDGTVYLFRGKYFYEFPKGEHRANGTAKLISAHFPGLPDPIDAAYTRILGMTVFLVGKNVYVFINKRYLAGPIPISQYYDGIPEDIDAAIVSKDFYGQTYLFKGNLVYRLSDTLNTVNSVDTAAGFPSSTASWNLALSSYTAALTHHNDATYFFYNGDMYSKQQGTQTVNGYPAHTKVGWFGCPGPVPAPIQDGDKVGNNEDGD